MVVEDPELFVTIHPLVADLIGVMEELGLKQKDLEVDLETEDPLYQLES